MVRSGQTYGLNGQAMLLGSAHEGILGSDDLIRIIPNQAAIDPGYLLVVLTHPTLGRPMVIRNAYGTSIPHLDPADVRAVPVPRFSARIERKIAELATESARLRDEADAHENAAAELAAKVIQDFTSKC